jgi:hypothetical protein
MTELPEPKQFGDYGRWPGRAVLDQTGARLGEVREIYLDDATDRPEWVLVTREEREPRFVPLADATIETDIIRVAASSASVETAPSLAPTTQLTQDQERELYTHYGVPLDEQASDSLLPATDDGAGDQPTPAVDQPTAATDDPPAVADDRPAADGTPVTADSGPTAAPIPVPVPEPPVATGPIATPTPEPVATGPTPLGDPPAAASELDTPDVPELPAPGETSEPEDRGPMIPPRPEPVPPPRVEQEPTGPSGPFAALRSKPMPLLVGIAVAIVAAIFVVRRRS